MELLVRLAGLWFLICSAGTSADANGSKVTVIVKEGSDVMLPCSISTNIESKRFVWRKDGQKEVFLYDAGLHSNNGRPGQDEQFKGRVSHFKDELKSGNASILIRNTKVTDSGDYICGFPGLPPSGQIFHVQLVVGPIKVEEGSDVMLPCSTSTNIESKLFDWMKDGQKNVFQYDNGSHYNNDRQGQDEQFKGRVSHFEDELKSGNASILIRNTTVADSGVYTCYSLSQVFHVQLVVGAAPEPIVEILDQTKDSVLLLCAVRSVSPEPEVKWQDSANKTLPAKEQFSQRGGRYDIILQTTVTKTDLYHCVVTQKEINHQTRSSVYISGSKKVKEHSDVMLPCSVSTNIELKLFDWMKDRQKNVFQYVNGSHSNNGLQGQDEQFKGRVSHFEDELKSGNASILIRNTKLADSGGYTCGFPRLQPSGRIFYIQLVVGTSSTGRIVGGVLGGLLVGVVACVFVGFLVKHYMKLQYKKGQQTGTPSEKTEMNEGGANA